MAKHPAEDSHALSDLFNFVNNIQTEWEESLDVLAKAKEEIKNHDLFAIIDYLTFCDQLCHTIAMNLKILESQINRLLKLKSNFSRNPNDLLSLEEVISQLQELKMLQESKLQNIDEEYPVLAESVLRRSEDLISQRIEKMQQEKSTPPLSIQLNQNLENELLLQELKDSLETYREARENLIAEGTMGSSSQNLPEGIKSEDLGEELPEMDSILSQLDTLITSCDTALLINDIQE